ncbi:MAG: hypothetical protein R3B59_00795 [Dehalococcoidia bacterium]
MSFSDRIDTLDLIVAVISLLTTLGLGWATYRYTKRAYSQEFKPILRPHPRVDTEIRFARRSRSFLRIDVANDGAGPVTHLTIDASVSARRLRWFHLPTRRRCRLTPMVIQRLASGDTSTVSTPADPDTLESAIARDLHGVVLARGLDPSEYGVPEYMRDEWYEVTAKTLHLTLRLRYQQAAERLTRQEAFELHPVHGGASGRKLEGWSVEWATPRG